MSKVKTIVDNWGDALDVVTMNGTGNVVFLNNAAHRKDADSPVCDYAFDPEGARRLAKALKKAAKKAEAAR